MRERPPNTTVDPPRAVGDRIFVMHAIVDKLNQAIVKIASNPEFQERHMFNRGLTQVLDSPEQFAKAIEIEAALGRDVVKASGQRGVTQPCISPARTRFVSLGKEQGDSVATHLLRCGNVGVG
jgi:hypothetical protein